MAAFDLRATWTSDRERDASVSGALMESVLLGGPSRGRVIKRQKRQQFLPGDGGEARRRARVAERRPQRGRPSRPLAATSKERVLGVVDEPEYRLLSGLGERERGRDV